MRKRNKLYTANKWNRPLFMPDEEHNLFADGGYSPTQFSINKLPTTTSVSNTSGLFGYNSGLNINTPTLTQPTTSFNSNWNVGSAQASTNALVDNFSSEATANNPFKQYTYSGANGGEGGNSKAFWSALGGGAAAAAGTPTDKYQNGAFDAFDPIYHLAGGKSSEVGDSLSNTGVSVFKSAAASGNPWGMLAGAAFKVAGGLVNTFWGTKWNKELIARVENQTDAMKQGANYVASASTNDDFLNKAANLNYTKYSFSNDDVGVDGVWTNNGAKKARELRKNQEVAFNYMSHAIGTGAERADKNLDERVLAANPLYNKGAYGGFLNTADNTDNNMGAIDYGFMSDYLITKRKAAEAKNKVGGGNIFGSLQSPPLSTFALGGVMQSNGGDYSNGLTHISAGGTHESNPYEGVQLGISRENGNPNLVEEGETVFDDYVYSRRIKPDARTKKKFHLGKNSDTTFADLSKKLEKESLERPNDPISRAALKKQMHALAEEQERQKEEKQAMEAQEAFAQLPPEQQQAIMEQVAMEEQQAEQVAQQQQLSAEQQQQLAQQQPDAQQAMEVQMQEQPQMDEVQMAACGGKLNRFDNGGNMKKNIYKALGLYTDADFDKWREARKLDEIKDWENLTKNEAFMAELAKANPALGDAIAKGYDFGAFKPTASENLTFDFKHGGWGLEDYNAWNGSTDAAWKEAVEKGLVKEGMNSEEIGKALSQTDAYKRGSDWLKADEGNRLTYLQSILNSQDAPQAARDYAANYVDSNGWIKDAKRDYQTIFEDPNGTGVRNTHPGTYWKTPDEVLRESQTQNYEVAADGSIHEIIGDVPAEWKNVGSYKWQDAQTDYGNNYYTRPVANAGTTEATAPDEEKNVEPVHKPTWGRYAGLAGPLVGLGMQAAGVGKPDYTHMNKALDVMNGPTAYAEYQPIGNYLRYNPMDIWYEQNRLNANSRATDRAILNNSSPIGTKMAGLLANGYNNQIASGNLYRQALEYNDAQRQKVADFNRGTDMFNAEAFNKNSATNAEIFNNNKRARAQMTMEAALQRMNADASWYKGIYGNVNNLFKGLGDWGKENEQHNMIANMAADVLFGTLGDKQHISEDYVRTQSGKKAKGGRVNRKRGLTF